MSGHHTSCPSGTGWRPGAGRHQCWRRLSSLSVGVAAVLGFVALVGNELGTGDNFWGQLASGGGAPMTLVVFAVMVASFAPYVTGAVRHPCSASIPCVTSSSPVDLCGTLAGGMRCADEGACDARWTCGQL